MIAPEFSRPIRIDTLGDGPRRIAIAAEPGEREALATRFGLAAVDRLEAEIELTRQGERIEASGTLSAEVVQHCVVTGVALPARVAAPFALRFVPEAAAGDEIELGAADLDTIGYDGSAIDIGEAAAETMALALDPFPRAADADATLAAAGILSEDEAGPFAALKALKDKLGG